MMGLAGWRLAAASQESHLLSHRFLTPGVGLTSGSIRLTVRPMNEIPASAQPPAEAAAAEQTDAAQPGARSTLRFLISCAVVFMAGAGAILVIPHLDSGRVRGTQPGFVTFFGVGLVLILLTGGLVYFGLRSRFRTVPLVMVNIVVYNSLLVLVKFVFAPASLYAANVSRPLQTYLGSDPPTTAVVGAGLFALYAAAFWFLHGLITSRFVSWSGRFVLWLLPMLVVGLLTAMGAWVLVVLAVGDYLSLVLSTPATLFIGLALAGAVALASAAMVGIGGESRFVRDTTLLTSFLWIGLAFLALYHALWFVYMLVLVSIWPLRVVVPK